MDDSETSHLSPLVCFSSLALFCFSGNRCVVPDIKIETPVLDFQRCYLNHSNEQKVRLTNSSDLPACYGLLDQVQLNILFMRQEREAEFKLGLHMTAVLQIQMHAH